MSGRELKDAPARQRATLELGRCFEVEASAGTGKTRLIVERTVNLVEREGVPITAIAVITFTDKAATELEEKIREEIRSRLAEPSGGEPETIHLHGTQGASETTRAIRIERLLAARDEIDAAPIQTIHSFAAALLRSRPVEAGVDPAFAVLDQDAQRRLRDDVWDRYLAGEATSASPILGALLDAGIALRSIKEQAERALEHLDLTLERPPRRTELPDLARRVAELRSWIRGERERLAADCGDPGDTLLRFLADAEGSAARVAEAGAARARRALVGGTLIRAGKKSMGRKQSWTATGLEEARRAAQDWDARVAAIETVLGSHIAGEAEAWIRGFLEAYEARKRSEGVLDFQDLLRFARRLLARSEVARQLRSRYPRVLVDEFQDTDPLQVEIAALLTGEGEGADWHEKVPAPGALFIVGDPKQSIYRFRRADIAVYREAQRWIEARCGPGSRLEIATNFRCRPGVTDWVNALFPNLFDGKGASPPYSPLHPDRPGLEAPSVLYLVPVGDDPEGAADETSSAAGAGPRGANAEARREQEALTIGLAVRAALDSGAWTVAEGRPEMQRPARAGDVAILLRSFSDVRIYEDGLRRAGVDCVTAGGRRYYVRPEVAWFSSLLRAVDRPHDEIAVVAALRSPFFGFTDAEILEARLALGGLDPLAAGRTDDAVESALAVLGAWHRTRDTAPLGVTVRRILEGSHALALAALEPQGSQESLNLLKVVDLARRHESEGGSFRTFIRALGRARREEPDEGDAPLLEAGENAVRITTIHKAKGLEFPVVVLADLSRKTPAQPRFVVNRAAGRVEMAFKTGPRGEEFEFATGGYEEVREAEDEVRRGERHRLLYVAATRARDLLVLPVCGEAEIGSFMEDLKAGSAIPVELDGSPGRSGTVDDDAPDEPATAARDVTPPASSPRKGRVRTGTERRSADGTRTDAAQGRTNAGGSGIHRMREASPVHAPREVVLPNGARAHVATVPIPEDPASGTPEARQRDERMLAAPERLARSLRNHRSWSDWEEARAAMIEGASRQGARILAASHVERAEEEGDGLEAAAPSRTAKLSDLPGLAPRVPDAPRPVRDEALAFGLAVHGVLERVDLAGGEGLEGIAAERARTSGIEGRGPDIAAAARAALASRIVGRAVSGRYLKEVPVSFVEEGTLVEGQADLVLENPDGSLIVVDYKTDAVAGAEGAHERGEAYRLQLALYAAALERASGRRVSELVLLFVTAGEEVRYPFDAQARELVRDALTTP